MSPTVNVTENKQDRTLDQHLPDTRAQNALSLLAKVSILLGGAALVIAAVAFIAFSAELLPSTLVALGGIALIATGFFNLSGSSEKPEESAGASHPASYLRDGHFFHG